MIKKSAISYVFLAVMLLISNVYASESDSADAVSHCFVVPVDTCAKFGGDIYDDPRNYTKPKPGPKPGKEPEYTWW